MTLTTDELRQIAETDHVQCGDAAAMARELLANREAQPVPAGKFAGWGLYHVGRDDFGSWLKRHPEDDSGDAITKHGYVNVKLFTAPPAPAVPDFKALADNLVENLVDCGGADEKVVEQYLAFAEKACRAAMLAQPVSQGYTLPPHVYRELVNSLRDTAVKFSGTEQLRERLNTALSQFIEPDHPHTRTVAPEGGNG
ncbi:hypothetical protein [Serratia marcescens]|uniref:hypothetical protein n=1 Tax=Serratia marcescens TaxID=615 RepID=UPI0032048A3A